MAGCFFIKKKGDKVEYGCNMVRVRTICSGLFLMKRRTCMAQDKGIKCCFCPNPLYPEEGYYMIQTTEGQFLGNVGPEELCQELRSFRKYGYQVEEIKGGLSTFL